MRFPPSHRHRCKTFPSKRGKRLASRSQVAGLDGQRPPVVVAVVQQKGPDKVLRQFCPGQGQAGSPCWLLRPERRGKCRRTAHPPWLIACSIDVPRTRKCTKAQGPSNDSPLHVYYNKRVFCTTVGFGVDATKTFHPTFVHYIIGRGMGGGTGPGTGMCIGCLTMGDAGLIP